MIRILIVDDSASVRELFYEMFSREDDFKVVGCAHDGASAVEMAKELSPDVITMDIHLPDFDGFAVTRNIMEEHPIPIVIVSAVYSASDAELGFRLLDTGALAFHDKPAFNSPDFSERMAEIVMSARLMSEVRVVRRTSSFKTSFVQERVDFSGVDVAEAGSGEIVYIGASTGGPQAINQLLSAILVNFAAPIIIVQHMSGGFLMGMINWLKSNSGHCFEIAKQGTIPRPGVIYLGPEDKHLEISVDGRFVLNSAPAVNGIRPTVDALFNSVARNAGKGAVAVLLTGMGRDGAEGLLKIRKSGGYTIAQDSKSSIVYGMPGEAVKLGAAVKVLPLDEISSEIVSHVCGQSGD